jgi:hypothetical protein
MIAFTSHYIGAISWCPKWALQEERYERKGLHWFYFNLIINKINDWSNAMLRTKKRNKKKTR